MGSASMPGGQNCRFRLIAADPKSWTAFFGRACASFRAPAEVREIDSPSAVELHALALQPQALRDVRAEDLAPADLTARIDDPMPGY